MPDKGMIYGYSRVSTVRQGENGNSLNEQEFQLRQAGAQEIYSDIFTGSTMDRPELSKLLERLEGGDTLIVTKLDRLARTAAEGSELIKGLINKGVTVNILNFGTADARPTGQLMLTILLAFAEFERTQIIERTAAGKAMARERGVRVDGRPKKFTPQQINHAMELLAAGKSYNEVAAMTGISRSTLLRESRARKAANEG